jgi:hypothetical protein
MTGIRSSAGAIEQDFGATRQDLKRTFPLITTPTGRCRQRRKRCHDGDYVDRAWNMPCVHCRPLLSSGMWPRSAMAFPTVISGERSEVVGPPLRSNQPATVRNEANPLSGGSGDFSTFRCHNPLVFRRNNQRMNEVHLMATSTLVLLWLILLFLFLAFAVGRWS